MNPTVLSYALLAVSTVGASLFAARTPVAAGPFAACVLAMAAAVLLMRRARKKRLSRDLPDEDAGGFDYRAALQAVHRRLVEIDKEDAAGCERIHTGLDEVIEGPMFDFAERREGLAALYGFAPFARLVGEFTRGERAVNRAWSSAVDGYPEEARDSVSRAREIFTALLDELQRIEREHRET